MLGFSLLSIHAQAFTLSNFKTPESILVDPEDGSYYVSNINGDPTEKDGNGYISKIGSTGNIVIEKFIGGGPKSEPLHAPKGLAIVGRYLYVTDIDTVKGYDKQTGKMEVLVDFSRFGVRFLSDLTPNSSGILYVSDMMTNQIFKIDTKNRHAVKLFKQSKVLGGPNGLLINPKTRNLIVVTWHTGQILEIDASGRAHILKRGLKSLDGVDYDKEGNLYVSSFEKGEIYKITYWGRGSISTFLSGLTSPADVSCDRIKNELLIPSFKANTVTTVNLNKDRVR
jgi:DNA-binding beta-propeller fold protein YncE